MEGDTDDINAGEAGASAEGDAGDGVGMRGLVVPLADAGGTASDDDAAEGECGAVGGVVGIGDVGAGAAALASPVVVCGRAQEVCA